MNCLCRNLLNSSSIRMAIISVEDVGGTILGYDVVKSLDKGLG